MQSSLAKLAHTMKAEKDHAMEAANSLGANLVAVEKISGNLHQLFEKTHETASGVEHLNERATQFGGASRMPNRLIVRNRPKGAAKAFGLYQSAT